MTGIVRVAVLSDLHFASNEAGEKEAPKETHVILSQQMVPKQHPVGDLLRLIDNENLTANIVLCPGDITYHAEQAALKAAWAAINDIASKLGADHVIAATGNHDIVSRDASTSPEIWEQLKQLRPKYPYTKATLEQQLYYWAEHFLVAEVCGIRFVVLNTCNCHARGKDEYLHGRVTDYTISQIEDVLSQQGRRDFNVLLCHHHPMKHPDLSQSFPDYSEMRQGAKLLSMLEGTGDPWIVVHGHKHSPRLDYATGESTDAPLIFSAGSFSAVLSPKYFAGTSNQFYIIELDLDYISKYGKAGLVYAWDWQEGHGWQVAPPKSGTKGRIPNKAGFGHRVNISYDAQSVAKKFSGEKRVAWASVEQAFPWIKYVTPADLEKIVRRLKSHHKLDAMIDGNSIHPYELLQESAP